MYTKQVEVQGEKTYFATYEVWGKLLEGMNRQKLSKRLGGMITNPYYSNETCCC